jgi:hypothetical protein
LLKEVRRSGKFVEACCQSSFERCVPHLHLPGTGKPPCRKLFCRNLRNCSQNYEPSISHSCFQGIYKYNVCRIVCRCWGRGERDRRRPPSTLSFFRRVLPPLAVSTRRPDRILGHIRSSRLRVLPADRAWAQPGLGSSISTNMQGEQHGPNLNLNPPPNEVPSEQVMSTFNLLG